MKRTIGKRSAFWLLATLALLLLAACGQTTVTPDTHSLSVSVTGDGSVTGLAGDIDCTGADEATCTTTVDDGKAVTLTATANVEGETVTWGGACSTATGSTCTVTVNGDTNVTAAFGAAADPQLSVTVNGDGSVASDPAGIDCGASCEATFASGTEVTLTATNGTDAFQSWGGACSGTANTCTLTITDDTIVSANFGNFSTAHRRAYSADTSLPNAAELSVTYTPSGGVPTTVTSQVAQPAHDAEELLMASTNDATKYPAGHTFIDSSDIELGFDPGHGPQLVGLLFQNVDIPAGSVVDSATITFTAYSSPDTGDAADVILTIEGQDSVNPDAFVDDLDGTAGNGISSRTRVATPVTWTASGTWTADTTNASADISAIVQAIIELPGWDNLANGMAFIISPQ